MNIIIKGASGFMGLFDTGAETFISWVSGIVPKVLLLLILMNTIIALIGQERVNKFAKVCSGNVILAYGVLPCRFCVLPQCGRPQPVCPQAEISIKFRRLIPMSGHSKWNNIKRKKEKTDGARAKVFTKIGREISVAVRMGGPNPASNSKLADLIAKAKRMSVPNDNIQRIIKKAEGGDKTEYEAITYEGYGPGGVAVMVETLTDNRNRTAADLRHYFDKNGGNLGAMGCVAFLFSQKGVIDISLEDKDADEAMMDALDAGAEDFDASEDAAEITTDPENYSAVVKALEEKGYEILSDDLAMVPMTTTRLTDPDQLKQMGKLLDSLEDNDDVQNVWHSLENEEDLPE